MNSTPNNAEHGVRIIGGGQGFAGVGTQGSEFHVDPQNATASSTMGNPPFMPVGHGNKWMTQPSQGLQQSNGAELTADGNARWGGWVLVGVL